MLAARLEGLLRPPIRSPGRFLCRLQTHSSVAVAESNGTSERPSSSPRLIGRDVPGNARLPQESALPPTRRRSGGSALSRRLTGIPAARRISDVLHLRRASRRRSDPERDLRQLDTLTRTSCPTGLPAHQCDHPLLEPHPNSRHTAPRRPIIEGSLVEGLRVAVPPDAA
jgi:hypothetical protein